MHTPAVKFNTVRHQKSRLTTRIFHFSAIVSRRTGSNRPGYPRAHEADIFEKTGIDTVSYNASANQAVPTTSS